MWVVKAKLPPAEGELLVKALNAITERDEDDVREDVTQPGDVARGH